MDQEIGFVALWMCSAIACGKAVYANRRTSLIFASVWACLAWGQLTAAFIVVSAASLYVALALVGCAAVAVLGARWPGTAAWQFVVLALLGVLHLPFAESAISNRPLELSPVRWTFASGLLVVTFLNYLPTRLGFPALMLGLAGVSASLRISEARGAWVHALQLAGAFGAFAAPALAWLMLCTRRPRTAPTTRLWLDFRDRFGAIWALRVMEQFNRSAANAGSTSTLAWSELRGPDDAAAYERLTALLKRFGMPATDQKLGPAGPPPPPP